MRRTVSWLLFDAQQLFALGSLECRSYPAEPCRRVGCGRYFGPAPVDLLQRCIVALTPRAFSACGCATGPVDGDSGQRVGVLDAGVDVGRTHAPSDLVDGLACGLGIDGAEDDVRAKPSAWHRFHPFGKCRHAKGGIDLPKPAGYHMDLAFTHFARTDIL